MPDPSLVPPSHRRPANRWPSKQDDNDPYDTAVDYDYKQTRYPTYYRNNDGSRDNKQLPQDLYGKYFPNTNYRNAFYDAYRDPENHDDPRYRNPFTMSDFDETYPDSAAEDILNEKYKDVHGEHEDAEDDDDDDDDDGKLVNVADVPQVFSLLYLVLIQKLYTCNKR
jgi:hypothetical protein